MAGGSHERVGVLTVEINKLMDMEECMWNQRSNTEWLRYGVKIRNTSTIGPQREINETLSQA